MTEEAINVKGCEVARNSDKKRTQGNLRSEDRTEEDGECMS